MIRIVNEDILTVDVDAIVNAANAQLQAGGGVCGAIFNASGYTELQQTCNKIGSCKTGSAVITPGFKLKAKYIIHAVGPIWHGGQDGEEKDLYGCYKASLNLAKENGCKSIAFPLISSGIYGYPIEEAWKVALSAADDFSINNPEMEIIFADNDLGKVLIGKKILKEDFDNKI